MLLPKFLHKKKKPVLLGPEIRRTYMDKVVPPTPPGATCLLVGVVEEAEPRLLAGKGYQVTKADLQPKNPEIVPMDLTQPTEEHHGRYDIVVCFDVLEHIEDDQAALGGIQAVLKPGGTAYVHVPGGDANAPLDENDKKHGHARHGYNEAQAKEMIHSQSWANVEYLKTFGPAELDAYMLALDGYVTLGRKKLKRCTFDGKQGKAHLFVLKKHT